MAVKRTGYSRTFISKTEQTDTSMHGSPTWEDYQTINDKDKEIREEIIRQFAFHQKEREYEGFDGKIWYSWIMPTPGQVGEGSQNIEYQIKISIQKTGNEKDLESWSDLEKFLIKNGFNELK